MKKTFIVASVIVLIFVLLTGFLLYKAWLNNLSDFNTELIGYMEDKNELKTLLDDFQNQSFFNKNLTSLKEQILALKGVESVSTKIESFSSLRLIIKCKEPPVLLIETENEENTVVGYYCLKDGVLVPTDSAIKHEYEVEISPGLRHNLQLFGVNEQIYEVLTMLGRLVVDKSLKISAKYDNNISGNLAWLVLTIEQLQIQVFVKDEVSYQRLKTALRLAISQSSGVFDLYSNALVKRN